MDCFIYIKKIRHIQTSISQTLAKTDQRNRTVDRQLTYEPINEHGDASTHARTHAQLYACLHTHTRARALTNFDICTRLIKTKMSFKFCERIQNSFIFDSEILAVSFLPFLSVFFPQRKKKIHGIY